MKKLLAPLSLALAMLTPFAAWSQVSVVVDIAPPPLPMYAQPLVPGEGFIWMPGYWAWSVSDHDYYWVPGTWVLAPNVGDLWTPGYWAFAGAGYFWHGGYWGRSVGYYGGLNYGYGYTGSGYQGGRWEHGVFRYNRAVSHVDTSVVHNVYNAQVVNRNASNHVSFNGGAAGARVSPTASQRQMQAAVHAGPTADQLQHERTAVTTPAQRASISHGAPPVAATRRPSAFAEPGVERSRANAAVHASPGGTTQQVPRAAPQPQAHHEQPRPEEGLHR